MENILIQTEEYQKIFLPSGYVSINIDGHWMKEHRFVVEQFIGRELNSKEVIHHLNNIKSDNRISNLMLFKNESEHIKFHNKVNQFKLTNPIIKQINNRWNEFFKEG